MASNNKNPNQTQRARSTGRPAQPQADFLGVDNPNTNFVDLQDQMKNLRREFQELNLQVSGQELRLRQRQSTRNWYTELITNLERRIYDLERVELGYSRTELRQNAVEDYRREFTDMMSRQREIQQGIVSDYDPDIAKAQMGPDPLDPPPPKPAARQRKRQDPTNGKETPKEKEKKQAKRQPSKNNKKDLLPPPPSEEQDDSEPGMKNDSDEYHEKQFDDDVLFLQTRPKPGAEF
ncbi:hypothetical protein QBC37DRAFT_403651 [Rhypophila decipiens]|uniref:Uncharacterized protein n=1 Tax=Rhypophila decipiens TaxID=261697 RepID=A0AAN7B4Z0_9PEZI|nr:hypothetical protein QBC37DRAFT_403651 [Rhypophila decipiens]